MRKKFPYEDGPPKVLMCFTPTPINGVEKIMESVSYMNGFLNEQEFFDTIRYNPQSYRFDNWNTDKDVWAKNKMKEVGLMFANEEGEW
jgi:hypothetical protein